MKLLDIYSYLFASWINGGMFNRAGRLQSTSIDAQYNVVFTKTHVKQVYRIMGIKPENYDLAFVDYIRARMFETHPDVELVINEINHPIRLNVNDDKFNRAFSKASTAYSDYKEAFDSQTGIARITGKTYRLPGGGRLKLSRERLDDLNQIYQSYLYLFNSMSAGGTVSLVNIFIEVVGADMREVRRAGNDLYGILGALNIGVELVKSANKAYMLEMGPAVGSPQKLNKKFLPQLLFTAENQAAWSTYKSRGLVGGGKGAILLGMDFRSRLPFSIDIFRSGAAQIFLLNAKTGGGKTYAAFQLALSALANNHYVSAIDLKGREWSALTVAVPDAKIITFDNRHPSFVNCLRLDDMPYNEKNAGELFGAAIDGTVQLFMLVIHLLPGEGNPNDAELVIREAVQKMYSSRNIDPANPSSFANSKGMTYADVLPILETLATTTSYTKEQKNMVRLARARLHAYFGESGMFREAMRNEVTLGDVLDAKLTIFELNKNQNTMFDSLDVIRVFMIQFLNGKKQTVLKERGEFCFQFFEELQRCEQMTDLLRYICAQVTGARSANMIVVLLLNSLKVLQGKEAQDIRSNITSILSGLVEDNDIRSFRDDFGRPWLAHQLELISARQQTYRNCFAASVDPGYGSVLETVYRVELPKDLSKAFRTRTIVDE